MRRQPIRFAINVGQGKAPLVTGINFEIRKRNTLPKPPPKKINNSVFTFGLNI
jgi:hypothetical protein